jgi:hypothetical protein
VTSEGHEITREGEVLWLHINRTRGAGHRNVLSQNDLQSVQGIVMETFINSIGWRSRTKHKVVLSYIQFDSPVAKRLFDRDDFQHAIRLFDLSGANQPGDL